jgi:predicted  nucleic acid-binding Zn-ribbon protein
VTHRCVRCGAVFQDEDPSILRGCSKCGSIFFLMMKDAQDLRQIEDMKRELESKDTNLEAEITRQIEEKKTEERKVTQTGPGIKLAKVSQPVKGRKGKFGIETVKIPKEGVYEINIDALMKKRPLVILEKGKIYLIHLPSAFETKKNGK